MAHEMSKAWRDAETNGWSLPESAVLCTIPDSTSDARDFSLESPSVRWIVDPLFLKARKPRKGERWARESRSSAMAGGRTAANQSSPQTGQRIGSRAATDASMAIHGPLRDVSSRSRLGPRHQSFARCNVSGLHSLALNALYQRMLLEVLTDPGVSSANAEGTLAQSQEAKVPQDSTLPTYAYIPCCVWAACCYIESCLPISSEW